MRHCIRLGFVARFWQALPLRFFLLFFYSVIYISFYVVFIGPFECHQKDVHIFCDWPSETSFLDSIKVGGSVIVFRFRFSNSNVWECHHPRTIGVTFENLSKDVPPLCWGFIFMHYTITVISALFYTQLWWNIVSHC